MQHLQTLNRGFLASAPSVCITPQMLSMPTLPFVPTANNRAPSFDRKQAKSAPPLSDAARADLAADGAERLVTKPGAVFAPAATILQLPPDVIPYKRLPAEGTFTVDTMPRGLLSRHNTKEAVWGEINVVKGQLQLNQLEGEIEEVLLSPSNSIGVVAPTQYHVVKPLTDDMEMFIRFCARPGTGPLALTPGDDTGGGDGTQKPRRRERGYG